MPLAEIFFPRRLSNVSSMPKTSGPSGTKASTSSPNRTRLASRLDQTARLSTRWERQKRRSSSRLTARSAEATVLLPGARIAPTSSSWTCSKTLLEKSGANGASTCIIDFGRVWHRSPLFERTGDERTLPFSLTNGQSPANPTVPLTWMRGILSTHKTGEEPDDRPRHTEQTTDPDYPSAVEYLPRSAAFSHRAPLLEARGQRANVSLP